MPVDTDNFSSFPNGSEELFLKFRTPIDSGINIYAQHIFSKGNYIQLSGKVSVEMKNCQYLLRFETADLIVPAEDYVVIPHSHEIWAKKPGTFDVDYLKVININVTRRNAKTIHIDDEGSYLYNNNNEILLSWSKTLRKPLTLWEKLQKALKPLINP